MELKEKFIKSFRDYFITLGIMVSLLVPIVLCGYAPAVINPNSHSMDDSLGHFGFGFYKNYKSPFTQTIYQAEYLNGNNTAVTQNLSIVAEEVNIGDVIIFYKRGTMVIHEVVATQGGGYITKGTNNKYQDGFIPHEAVFGKLVFWVKIW